MRGKTFTLSPEVTPLDFSKQHEELRVVPDGTGLQILFAIEGNYYLLAGPRFDGRLITCNGGAIDNNTVSFLEQLQLELREETFGMLNLEQTATGNYQLRIMGDEKQYPLTMKPSQTFVKLGHNYCYVTFTAVCEGLSLQQLETISNTMNPTAKFWYSIGTHLHKPQKSPAELLKELEDKPTMIKPEEVLGKLGLKALLVTDNMAAMKKTVGNYSERPAYYVFDLAALIPAIRADRPLCDIKGNVIAGRALNGDVVCNLSSLMKVTAQPKLTEGGHFFDCDPEAAAVARGLAQRGLFTGESKRSASSSESSEASCTIS